MKNVFDYLLKNGTNTALHDKILTPNPATVFRGQRINTIIHFEIDSVLIKNECVMFSSKKVLKHTKSRRNRNQLTYRPFPQKEFSAINCFKQYLRRGSMKVHTDIQKY